MLVTLVVSLYTSRVVLNSLGVEDFGIYNVVGGVIVLFSFLSVALRVSTQRFVSYELGLGDDGDVRRIFFMSLQCLFIIGLLVVVLGETVGLWFVNNKLNIPIERVSSAHWVYQITILTFIANLLQVPFQATIVAYEKMSFYAYVGIVDVILKLAVAFCITVTPFDKLIVYAFLILVVAVIGVLLPAWYCKAKLKVGGYYIVKDKLLFGQMMGFSGWSMVNGGAVITAQQGGNILLNIFSGVIANGAFGIANQVSGAIYNFVSNFQSAFQPQIVKQYASRDYVDMHVLMNRAGVFSYYLLLIISVPFCFSADYVLYLWLGQVPEYASGFIILLLLYSLIDAIEAPLWMLIGATGKMKVYTIWSGAITVLNVPLAWFFLKIGYSVYWVFIVRVLLNLICGIIRPLYVRSLVNSFSIRQWLASLLRPFAVTTILLGCTAIYYSMKIDVHPVYLIIISFLFTSFLIWFVGMSQSEQKWIVSNILKRNKQ